MSPEKRAKTKDAIELMFYASQDSFRAYHSQEFQD